jgi:hypothetical protein
MLHVMNGEWKGIITIDEIQRHHANRTFPAG